MPAHCVVVCFEDATRRRLLVVRHARRGWELPGGRLEAGESPVEASIREFLEETGHELVDPRPVARLPRDGHLITGLLGSRRGEPKPDEAIVERRLVERLAEVSPLSFPDDPYPLYGDLLGRPL